MLDLNSAKILVKKEMDVYLGFNDSTSNFVETGLTNYVLDVEAATK